MLGSFLGQLLGVHCRIGSLGRVKKDKHNKYFVHCRIGSLGMSRPAGSQRAWVHCRIGSLGMDARARIA